MDINLINSIAVAKQRVIDEAKREAHRLEAEYGLEFSEHLFQTYVFAVEDANQMFYHDLENLAKGE